MTTIRLRQFLILIVDLALMYGALYLTLMLRYLAPVDTTLWAAHRVPFTIIFFVWIITLYLNGFYDLRLTTNTAAYFHSFFGALAINVILSIGFFYIVSIDAVSPKTNLLLFALIYSIVFIVWRWLYNRFVGTQLLRMRIAFLGNSAEVHELAKLLHASPYLGYTVAGVYTFENIDALHAAMRTTPIDLVVVGADIGTLGSHAQMLYKTIFLNVTFVELLDFYETITGRVPVAVVNELWFIEHVRPAHKRLYEIGKRLLDGALTIIMLTLFLIAVVPVSLLILATNGRPIFYTQERVGHRGKLFSIIKFRTMRRDAEKEGAPQWAQANDRRATFIGKILRRTHIDELPQVLNILHGDMSFIGPRPERPHFVQELERAMPFYAIRHLIKPGLTGWAQVRYPYAASVEENLRKLQYDLFYVKNRSLFMDLLILIRTINILTGR
ncbi:sugar transferase [Candidatus Uhrbacteria bacterium]|nr:sugar transferase [Candidatus Uhrbacteria bacterium]